MEPCVYFLYLSHLLYEIWVKIFIMNRWYISKSHTTSKNTIDRQYTERGQLQCWMLPKRGSNAERKSEKVHEEQKGNRETTQRMGNKVTDRAKVGSCFSFYHFRVRSLFLIPRFSSILACRHRRISGRRFSPPGWRDRKYVCVRSSGQQHSGSLAEFQKGSSRHLKKP